jgi:glycosyltransferase involved in cell wall biosynthesis
VSPVDAVAVVIPARDEAASVGAAVASVRRALEHPLVAALPSLVVVVADSCRDATAAVARAGLAPTDRVVECEEGTAGGARRTGTEAALAWWPGPTEGLWLAHTDADSSVPPDWIARQVDLARRGASCVTGLVALDECSPLLRARFAQVYGAGVDVRSHGHVHGANLGLRASVYADVGGWQGLATGEDHDLWRRALAIGAACHHDTRLVVRTSSRLRGRAPRGFAADLAELARRSPVLVEAHPPDRDADLHQ